MNFRLSAASGERNTFVGVIESFARSFGIKTKAAEQLTADGAGCCSVECHVVHEDVLTVEIEEIGTYALMWTPTEDNTSAIGYTIEDGILGEGGVPESLALAAGFAFTEGIVDSLADIANMAVCPERPDVVRMRLTHPSGVAVRRRNVVMNSSCGICGGREQLASRFACTPPVPDTLRMSVADFAGVREAMHRHQGIFGQTGGTHGAAVFDSDLMVVAVAEDLGRHNALDKVIGYRFLSDLGFAGCGVFISSRVSYEMVAKSARAGFELVAAISAPSSLAIEMADRFGITLGGFVRGDSAKIYTHPHRIVARAGNSFLA
ncbi:Sulfur carrier protein FdhD [Georgfuchsia toluolica]|uniref:Sulfur carrier protein FdhD n=1 Tax=Georgfuchsia toluolica TaxID=424218 RepID=A0A916N071_9PROT|nr:formate dehydrogenase accessory sulfurtransferase FdhD [Georgfuchsia toluolica]CAG4883613.1 Sulfur carrier protein FdhD [Georgfuchsia toluolica]